MKKLLTIILFLLTFTENGFCQGVICYNVTDRGPIPINLNKIVPELNEFAKLNNFSDRKIFAKIIAKENGSVKDIKLFNQDIKEVEIIESILFEMEFMPCLKNGEVSESNYFLTVHFSTNLKEKEPSGNYFPLKENEELIISINN